MFETTFLKALMQFLKSKSRSTYCIAKISNIWHSPSVKNFINILPHLNAVYHTLNAEILTKIMEFLECNLSEDLQFVKFRIIKCTIIKNFVDNLILLQGKNKNLGLIGCVEICVESTTLLTLYIVQWCTY